MPTSPSVESFIALFGGFPEPTPLDIQVLSVSGEAGYTRQLIEYTAYEENRVQSYLLLPRQTGQQLPAVLAIHQDRPDDRYDIGKSEPAGLVGDANLHYGHELCLRGYVVLCPDRAGFESRHAMVDAGGEPPLPFRREIYDLHRAVDCLLSQPEVDPQRLGVIGHSAGGWLASLLTYTHPKIRVCVTSCATWLWRWSGERKPAQLAGLNVPPPPVPGLLAWGDQDDVLAGIAPRPYLESGDPWPPAFEEELTRKARLRYVDLGVPERFQKIIYQAGHTFRADMREQSYQWLDQWLATK